MSAIETGSFRPRGEDDSLESVPPRPGRLGQWIGAICLAFVVAALFGLVGFHAKIAEEQNMLDQLESTLEDARVENDRLKLAVGQLESPARIVATAKGSLGMVEPLEIHYLTPPAEPLSAHEVRNAFLGRTNNDRTPAGADQ